MHKVKEAPMRLKSALLASLIVLTAPNAGFAQEYKAATAFSGNELRLYVMNQVNADCTSGLRPDVHVVNPPANGSIRMEPVAQTVDRVATDPMAKCNGKKVDGLAVFYTSKFAYVGLDKLVLEADFHTGNIRRYEVLLEVR
jgi:hypothetical protein